jgi:tungstate transport system substrate-binding protein
MNKHRYFLVALVLTGLLASIAACSTSAPSPAVQATTQATTPATSIPRTNDPQRLILATTTSTQDSGLLEYILPDFKKKYNATVDVIAVGTGQAIQLGTRGDADVLLVHARAQEDAFVKAGDGTARYDVMYNDFVIVGPTADPAGIKGLARATDAFKQIADKQAPFVSRGDDSGTYTKEMSIWATLKITPKGDWYVSAGQGMGAVLTMASEQGAYTLSDRATYAARKAKGLALDILVEGDKILFNPYGVIPVNPAKHPQVNAKLAETFVNWLISLETQELIASYQIGGQQLFTPDSEAWRAAHATATAEATAVATSESN